MSLHIRTPLPSVGESFQSHSSDRSRFQRPTNDDVPALRAQGGSNSARQSFNTLQQFRPAVLAKEQLLVSTKVAALLEQSRARRAQSRSRFCDSVSEHRNFVLLGCSKRNSRRSKEMGCCVGVVTLKSDQSVSAGNRRRVRLQVS